MKLILIIIAAFFIVQFSMYAQSTGQVTLSIRLYPIQIIEVDHSNTLSLEVLNDNLLDSSLSSQLSTFSTSHYSLKIDTIQNSEMQDSNSINGVPPRQNLSNKNRSMEQHEEGYEDNDYLIIYNMVTQ